MGFNFWWLLYPLIGAIAGILSGLMGIGGGIIVVPALAFLLPHLGFPPHLVMHMAVATSVACIVMTTSYAMRLHHCKQAVQWRLLWRILPSILLGAFIGATLASHLSTHLLKMIFGSCLTLIALYMLFTFEPVQKRPLPNTSILWLATTLLSSLAALLGLGGGALLVPFFTQFDLNMRDIVGTATACSFFIASMSLVTLMIAGHLAATPLAWSTGYVYWPAVLGIATASFLTAPLGVRLAHSLPTSALKKIFAAFLLPIALLMVLR
jgi:uncharacterized protein